MTQCKWDLYGDTLYNCSKNYTIEVLNDTVMIFRQINKDGTPGKNYYFASDSTHGNQLFE